MCMCLSYNNVCLILNNKRITVQRIDKKVYRFERKDRVMKISKCIQNSLSREEEGI